MDGIERALEILGLGPDAKPEDIKQAVRDLAKVWHPDRFPNNSRVQRKAEEKLKEINQAYEILKDYDFSSRTGSDPHSGTSNGPNPRQDHPGKEVVKQEAAAPPFGPSNRGKPTSPAKKPSNSLLGVSIFFLTAMSLIIFIIYAAFHKKEETAPPPPGQEHVALPENKLPNHLTKKIKDQDQIRNKEFFTIGSTKNEVLAVQGTPTEPSEFTWSYGLSQVNFHNGRVTGWYVNPLNPLKVKMLPADRRVQSKIFFTVGSTKDEVLAVQGTPTEPSEFTWSYGLSQVNFHNGRVTGWYVNPLNPLKVKMLPSD
jgi:hypothetical protein